MKIICAGAPRTGTTSLAAALRFLGLTVYDSPEQMAFQLEDWDDILRKGGEPDWRAMFNDVDAICDGPAFYFWEQMLDAFPDAVVRFPAILTYTTVAGTCALNGRIG